MENESENFTCLEFWKDVKVLCKKLPQKYFDNTLSKEEFNSLSDSEMIEALPLLFSITTTILNSAKENSLENVATKNGKQPFLEKGWVIYKLRWSIDKRGKSSGLRVIFAIGEKGIVFSSVKIKNSIENKEAKFQADSLERLKTFFDYDS